LFPKLALGFHTRDFNILPEKESKDDDDYMWGRLQLNENRIIFWHTESEAFTKAIEERQKYNKPGGSY